MARRITPLASEAEKQKVFAREACARLEEELSGYGVKMHFVGSAARDTGLRGNNDVDLFVSFPRVLEEDFIVKETKRAAKKLFDVGWVMHYAEHPYLKAVVDGFDTEVIPCFEHDEDAPLKSAVDRSPLHMQYLEKRLSARQKRDVRVLKKFLKNAGLYGAELAVQGFSGLLCEYLVLYYGSFYELVKAAESWRPPVRIDLEGRSNKGFDEPLVVIDAIDANRNVAAVLSETNLHRFMALSQAFIEKPSLKFFFRKHVKPTTAQARKALRERGTFTVAMRFKAPQLVEDILVPQLRKSERGLSRQLEVAGFPLLAARSFIHEGKCFMLFEFGSEERPTVQRMRGPFAWDSASVTRFSRAHNTPLKGPFIKGERVFVEVKVKERNALRFLKKLSKNTDVYASGSYLEPGLRRAKFLSGMELVKQAPVQAYDFFKRKEFWW